MSRCVQFTKEEKKFQGPNRAARSREYRLTTDITVPLIGVNLMIIIYELLLG